MHSSRMLTVRCSGRLIWRWWCLPGGVGVCLGQGCLPWGGVGVSARGGGGGVCPSASLSQFGIPLPVFLLKRPSYVLNSFVFLTLVLIWLSSSLSENEVFNLLTRSLTRSVTFTWAVSRLLQISVI